MMSDWASSAFSGPGFRLGTGRSESPERPGVRLGTGRSESPERPEVAGVHDVHSSPRARSADPSFYDQLLPAGFESTDAGAALRLAQEQSGESPETIHAACVHAVSRIERTVTYAKCWEQALPDSFAIEDQLTKEIIDQIRADLR